MERRNTMVHSRRLFSVYRYKKVTMSAKVESKSQEMCIKDDTINSVLNSCMHCYKRDLSPVKENYPALNPRTPYKQNFQTYELNMMSKNFKSSLLKSMGDSVSCVTSYCPNGSRITTYCKQVEQKFNNPQFKQQTLPTVGS